MKQLMASTRGTYDLHNGKLLKNKPVFITPKDKFNKLKNAKEVVIFVHGMRNSTVGAKMGTNALRLRLRKLGYKHPIIGFSYDSNVRGAHIPSNYHKVLHTAYNIADKNGGKLAELIRKIKQKNPYIRIRLVGHSLGCEVIKSTVHQSAILIPNVYLFGSPIECDNLVSDYNWISVMNIVNYYNPNDNVIKEGVINGDLTEPSCLYRIENVKNASTTIKSKRIYAKDHRFKSQIKALRSFP